MKTKRKPARPTVHLRLAAQSEARAVPWRLQECQKALAVAANARYKIQQLAFTVDRQIQIIEGHVVAMYQLHDKNGLFVKNGIRQPKEVK